MPNPRFTLSKEDRSCGPVGRFIRSEKGEFVTKKPWRRFQPKVKYPIVGIRRKSVFQVSKQEVLEYFGLE